VLGCDVRAVLILEKFSNLFKFIFSLRFLAEFSRKKNERKRRNEFDMISKNLKFKDIHKGQRCFIIGNGPSIKDVDFTKLSNEITFTVNQLPRLKKFPQLMTNYHIWCDERFFNLDKEDENDMELLEVMKKVKTDNNSPVVFYKTSACAMIKEFKLDHVLNIEYFMDGPMVNELSDVDYPMDRMFPVFSTCIHYAIVIAVYMGFSEIYLLGCDCTGIINTINARIEDSKEFEYAYEINEKEKQRMKKVSEQTSIADEFLWYANLLKVYGVLFAYSQRHGCKLYNATSSSIMENVPRVKLENIIG
jgi:Protein of unknown function DUF115.